MGRIEGCIRLQKSIQDQERNIGPGNKNCANLVSWFLVRDLGSDLTYCGAYE
jgi:hypothetical protein